MADDYINNQISSKSATMGGNFSYRYRYDPVYYARVTAFGITVLTLLAAGANYYFNRDKEEHTYKYVLIIGGVLALIALILGPSYKRYDIRSSVAYCKRFLGPKASKKRIRACVEGRQNLEAMSTGLGF